MRTMDDKLIKSCILCGAKLRIVTLSIDMVPICPRCLEKIIDGEIPIEDLIEKADEYLKEVMVGS